MKTQVFKGVFTVHETLNSGGYVRRPRFNRSVNIYGETIAEYYSDLLFKAQVMCNESIDFCRQVYGSDWKEQKYSRFDNWFVYCSRSLIYPDSSTLSGALKGTDTGIDKPFSILRTALQVSDLAYYEREKMLNARAVYEPSQELTPGKKTFDAQYWQARTLEELQEYSYSPEEIQKLWDIECPLEEKRSKNSFPVFPPEVLKKISLMRRRKELA